MALLDYLSRSTSQSTVAIDAQPATVAEVPTLEPVIVEETKEQTPAATATVSEPVAAPEVLAASSEPTVVEPVCPPQPLILSSVAYSQVEKQPTTTHAETGTAHAETEVATKVDGTTAAPETEAKPEVKEKVAETDPAAEGSKAVVVEEPKEKKDKVSAKVCPHLPFYYSSLLSSPHHLFTFTTLHITLS